MSYQVLSRKWRPQTFEEVVGQRHITQSLQNSVKSGRLGHAYVLTGTRGIGKTSVARIFARTIRCLERSPDGNACLKCRACLDFDSQASMNIMELDGASHNSVDDIRALVGNVQTLPTFGDYKVYIIDEVHMLTISAFNALLKTLEEPPAHTVFIMATTEPHKIPDTVLSRCQRFDFRNASSEVIEDHLKKIATKENIIFESGEIAKHVATLAKGSFRDALSLLDQVLSFSENGHVTEEVVSSALGLVGQSALHRMTKAILLEDSQELSVVYRELLLNNVKLENIVMSLLERMFLVIQSVDSLESIGFTEAEIESIAHIEIDEYFWIYEGISKDTIWGLESVASESTVEIILQKYAMRSHLLGKKPSAQEKKKINLAKPVASMKAKSWNDFEKHLEEVAPALSAQLIHGNLLSEVKITKALVVAEYGFNDSALLFYDHLTQEGAKEKLEDLANNFFGCEKSSISFEKVKSSENFQSKAELIEEKIAEEKEKKISDFKMHPVVQEAEKIFGSQIDKIKLKE